MDPRYRGCREDHRKANLQSTTLAQLHVFDCKSSGPAITRTNRAVPEVLQSQAHTTHPPALYQSHPSERALYRRDSCRAGSFSHNCTGNQSPGTCRPKLRSAFVVLCLQAEQYWFALSQMTSMDAAHAFFAGRERHGG